MDQKPDALAEKWTHAAWSHSKHKNSSVWLRVAMAGERGHESALACGRGATVALSDELTKGMFSEASNCRTTPRKLTSFSSASIDQLFSSATALGAL
jgi:hypothetical protein